MSANRPAGKHYLEDHFIAKQLQENEEKALAAFKIQPYQQKMDEAYANLLNATFNDFSAHQIAELTQKYTEAKRNFEQESNKINASNKQNSHRYIQAQLAKVQIAEEKRAYTAQPIRRFTAKEMDKINAHYNQLPDALKNLMKASISDEIISLDLMKDPVFIRSEGQVYDREELEQLFKKSQTARAPLNQDLIFTKNDIIPCNTLIQAMEKLLDIINVDDEKKIKSTIPEKLSSLLESNKKRVDDNLIKLIEAHYNNMPDKHKILFDIICRDPVTKMIMQDPVLLPDGYVYDSTTALTYIKYQGGQCPLNSDITFTEQDITRCYFVINVLDQMKQNIQMQIEKKKAEAALAILEQTPSSPKLGH